MEMGVLYEAYTNWVMIGFGIVGFIIFVAGVCAFFWCLNGAYDWGILGGVAAIVVGLAIGVPLFVFGFAAHDKYGDGCLKSHQASDGVYDTRGLFVIEDGRGSELVFSYNTETEQIFPDRFRVTLSGKEPEKHWRHISSFACVGIPFSKVEGAERFMPFSLESNSFIRTLAAPVDIPRWAIKYGDKWTFVNDVPAPALPSLPK
jgi:hypothetical protein